MKAFFGVIVGTIALTGLVDAAWADAGHGGSPKTETEQAEQEEMHQGMNQSGMSHGTGMMGNGMLSMPQMNPVRGRELFAEKGCVVCHSINGVGNENGLPLGVSTMEPMMSPFEFAARMWRGAEAMIALQQEELGGQIELTGQDLADIIAFAHNPAEQKKFSEEDIPHRIRELIDGHGHDQGNGHGSHSH